MLVGTNHEANVLDRPTTSPNGNIRTSASQTGLSPDAGTGGSWRSLLKLKIVA